MKAITVLFLFLGIAAHSFAQDDAIRKYFGKYADDARFTSVYISNKMFSMFSKLDDNADNKELHEILDKLGGLRILTSDQVDGAQMCQDAQHRLVTNGYEDLMEVKEKGNSKLRFMIREANGKVSELLMISGEGKQFFLLNLIGDIDLKKISKLSRALDVDGIKNLDKLDKTK